MTGPSECKQTPLIHFHGSNSESSWLPGKVRRLHPVHCKQACYYKLKIADKTGHWTHLIVVDVWFGRTVHSLRIMIFVIAHLCFLTSWLGVTAAPTRSPREVTYTCPPGLVWDPINEDCSPCSICYEYPDMEMCQTKACPGPTTPAAGQTLTLPFQQTTTVGNNGTGVKRLDGGVVAVIVLASILAAVGILLAIIYLLYKLRGNAPERAENTAEEELKLPVQEDQRGSSERVVTE